MVPFSCNQTASLQATSYQERDRILLKETGIIVRIDWLVEEHGIKCTDA